MHEEEAVAIAWQEVADTPDISREGARARLVSKLLYPYWEEVDDNIWFVYFPYELPEGVIRDPAEVIVLVGATTGKVRVREGM